MKPEHPTPIEITVTPDLMGAEMLRLLADAIEGEFNSERNESVVDAAPEPAFKLRRSTFRVLLPTRSCASSTAVPSARPPGHRSHHKTAPDGAQDR